MPSLPAQSESLFLDNVLVNVTLTDSRLRDITVFVLNRIIRDAISDIQGVLMENISAILRSDVYNWRIYQGQL